MLASPCPGTFGPRDSAAPPLIDNNFTLNTAGKRLGDYRLKIEKIAAWR